MQSIFKTWESSLHEMFGPIEFLIHHEPAEREGYEKIVVNFCNIYYDFLIKKNDFYTENIENSICMFTEISNSIRNHFVREGITAYFKKG